MTLYVRSPLSAKGTVSEGVVIEIINGRAEATEVLREDAVTLQKKAEKMRPDYEWQIDQAYSGKYVVRGQSEDLRERA